VSEREFFKMSGSGNDFVVFDARVEPAGRLASAPVIREVCARGTGVGADGMVFIEPTAADGAQFRMRYFNSDGSVAEMCGNAALCVTSLAAQLGAGSASGMRFETDSGIASARISDGQPEVDLWPVTDVRPAAEIPTEPGESRIGYAIVGNPHVVVLRDELETLEIVGRGRAIRMHEYVRPGGGANANFVARRGDGGFDIRTYERGVEAETLACGTGSVSTAILLTEWQQAGLETTLRTRSGRALTIKLSRQGSAWLPSLRGEGRVVFRGLLPVD
jgi:diaminopimelate epimerase